MKELKQEIVGWEAETRMWVEKYLWSLYDPDIAPNMEEATDVFIKAFRKLEAQAVERTREERLKAIDEWQEKRDKIVDMYFQEGYQAGKEETLREVTKKIKARLIEVPIPPQDEDWGINLTRTEIFNNGVLEARIAVLATLTAQLKGNDKEV